MPTLAATKLEDKGMSLTVYYDAGETNALREVARRHGISLEVAARRAVQGAFMGTPGTNPPQPSRADGGG